MNVFRSRGRAAGLAAAVAALTLLAAPALAGAHVGRVTESVWCVARARVRGLSQVCMVSHFVLLWVIAVRARGDTCTITAAAVRADEQASC